MYQKTFENGNLENKTYASQKFSNMSPSNSNVFSATAQTNLAVVL